MRPVTFRAARLDDLPAIVALLADDVLGAARDDPSLPLDPHYGVAFADIARDPNQLLAVADQDGEVIGTLQIVFLTGLSRRGARRGQIEAVRIAAACRNGGLGRAFMQWALAECRTRGCVVAQLSSDKSRNAAHRFYERLGFAATHEGYKTSL